MSSMGRAAWSEELQFARDLAQILVLAVACTPKARTAQDRENLGVPLRIERQEGFGKFLACLLAGAFARNPHIVDERRRGVEHAQLGAVELALRQHRAIDGLVYGPGIHGPGLDRFGGCRMAPRVAEAEIGAGRYAALFQRGIGHEMAARRIYVAEREGLASQIFQRIDR